MKSSSTTVSNRVVDHVARHVPTAAPSATAGEVRAAMLGRGYDCAESIIVVDPGQRVVGQITLSDLLKLDAHTPLQKAMRTGIPCVAEDTDPERVASLALQHELINVPVVDPDARLCGVVPAAALLGILRREHVEDLHRLAGIAHDDEVAKEAMEAPPGRRVRRRLPWLLLGLAGSSAAALLLAQFEEVLVRNITVAFFVPGIVYLADAIGTQTEAIAVRGLSLSNAGIGHLIGGELRAGLLLGAILGGLALGGIWLTVGDARLATTVALSLVLASALASTIGLTLPWLLSHLGQDPAYGSGPLATIIQDVLSLAVYFTIAAALLS